MSTIITKRQFPNYRKYELEVAGRPLFLEVGKLAELEQFVRYHAHLNRLFNNFVNFSDYYKLKTDVTDNYALNYGTDGKEVGCHGGMFGCPSGGRPQYVPYFTKVVVGQRTENGKLPVSLEVKIQDK